MPIYSSRAVDRSAPARMGQRETVVTPLLLVANVAAFLIEIQTGPSLDQFFQRWGLVPAAVSDAAREADPAVLFTFVSALFLHASWPHLLINLVYLAIFGASAERALGSPRFLALYLLGGLAGTAAHFFAQPGSTAPAIGASGAIAAVIAANLVIYPGATLGSVAPVLFFSSAQNLPVSALLVLWIVAQVLAGGGAVVNTSASGVPVAWASHAGGFFGGLLLAALLRTNRRRW